MMAEEVFIKLEGVGYTYLADTPFAQRALQGVSLEIGRGEFIALVGHTGSGKSTLIQHLNGLLRPDEGRIWVEGVEIGPATSGQLLASLRYQIGLLFQFPEQQLFEESVYADVAFGPRNMGLGEEEVKERVLEALSLVGLGAERYQNLSPFALSGGEKRRAALAGVLAMRPRCLILDEPTAGLDPLGAREIWELLRALNRERGLTVIAVSHRLEELAPLAKRLLVMAGGRLVVDAPLRQVLYDEELSRKVGLPHPALCQLFSWLRSQYPQLQGEPVGVEEFLQSLEEAFPQLVASASSP